MRKQTKLVAVLSAAALFAIGASMTSFAAARGWAQEDDTWVYLNSSGERVTEEWKRSGNNYYWLDENGEMAKNQIVESNDNYYYVNEDGVRLANQWVSVENTDDDTVDGKEVDVLWYYLGTTGRAYKSEDPDMLKTSLINGKRYFFDENAHMVSGWTTTMDSGSKEFTYYLGDENEGWAYTGWNFLEIPEEIQGEYDVDEAWFNFQSSGKARKSTRAYISNAYYSFDDNGVMLDDWQRGSDTVVTTPANIKLDDPNGKTFYNLETGNQGTGWVHTYQDDDEGGDEKWFYLESTKNNQVFNNNGKDANQNDVVAVKFVSGARDTSATPLSRVAAKVIKGKTYLFNNKGEMVTGVYRLGSDTDSDLKVRCSGGQALDQGFYYFSKNGGSAEGRMEKGRTTIDYDGEKFTYYFNKNGKACVNELNDGAVYNWRGVRVEAKDGNANQVYSISGSEGIASTPLKLGTKYFDAGSIIVSSTGKIRTGSVIIDDVRYIVNNYVVTDAYDRHDSDKTTLTDMFVPAHQVKWDDTAKDWVEVQ